MPWINETVHSGLSTSRSLVPLKVFVVSLEMCSISQGIRARPYGNPSTCQIDAKQQEGLNYWNIVLKYCFVFPQSNSGLLPSIWVMSWTFLIANQSQYNRFWLPQALVSKCYCLLLWDNTSLGTLFIFPWANVTNWSCFGAAWPPLGSLSVPILHVRANLFI